MTNNKLKEEILNLIALKQEGVYWDFKREWYGFEDYKKVDLLHDIICMANNLAFRDAYIIIGVDEENNYEVVNVRDDKNRRNTQQLVDFLKDVRFAGDVRPIVCVEEISVGDKYLDIIVIKKSKQTPFYLKEKYKNMLFPFHIYTRIQDTNTPKTNSADIDKVEELWKNRFHLFDTPIRKMTEFLKDKANWKNTVDYINQKDNQMYYIGSPEYKIEYELEDRDGIEPSSRPYTYGHESAYDHIWGRVRLYYHQTLLQELLFISFESSRYITTAPEHEILDLGKENRESVFYYFFMKKSLEYIIHQFYYNKTDWEEVHLREIFLTTVIVFDSEIEKEEFNKFLFKNWNNSNYHIKTDLPFDLRKKSQKEINYYLEAYKCKQLYEYFKEETQMILT